MMGLLASPCRHLLLSKFERVKRKDGMPRECWQGGPALSSLLLTLGELPEPGKLSDDFGFMLFPQFYPKSCLCELERDRCAIFCRVRLVFTMSL